MTREKEEHGPACAGCQILTLMHERDEAERRLSSFQHIGGGVYRVVGPRRSAITNRWVTDHLPDQAPIQADGGAER